MPAAIVRTDTYHLELTPGPDPLHRQGVNREPIYRLRRFLKYGARECGFRIRWGQITPPIELSEREHEFGGNMISFNDGPAVGRQLMLRRAPLFLRVTYDTLRLKWDALDQLDDKPASGEAIMVYRRTCKPSAMMLDWTEGGRRRGGKMAVASYAFVAEQPDDATMRDKAKWQAWCWSQVKQNKESPGSPERPNSTT